MEEQYINACKNGQTDAFSFLYEAHFESVYKFVYYKTMHKETAEDITSQTFLKALDKIGSFNAKQSMFKTWLFTIARNLIIDFYRTEKKYTDIDDVWDITLMSQEEDSPAIADFVDQQDSYKSLHQTLNKLDTKTRETLMLRFWHDLSWKEVAELQSDSVSATKMRASRGIKKLGTLMKVFILLINLTQL
ncbi:hypothetical protein CSB37_02765 [bacterium DOLZORAL124_38_8]|nr:MAG: hypothetical protein CSB37_02765 [bacterium DOLZORAL124_38_8]